MDFLDQLSDLTTVTTRIELDDALRRTMQAMGFERYAATVVLDKPGGGTVCKSAHNMPDAYLNVFNDIQDSTDPVMAHAKNSSLPLLWNQAYYVDHGEGERWEVQAPYGLRNGVVLASHHGSRHFCIGVESGVTLPKDPRAVCRVLADLSIFHAYALEAGMRVLNDDGPGVSTKSQATLTSRELEALKWTCDGKTAWEIGVILGIAESTVTKFLRSAQIKLEGANKVHTIARAIRMGIIT